MGMPTLERWRNDYFAIVVIIGCAYGFITSWEQHKLLAIMLFIGFIVCRTFAFFDVKRMWKKRVQQK
ncbi:hypothetical protein [Kurthia senegalensis]|uniref:hypothetical protein n=1 Tax=Kurthia senegalensis TaxID=1033740 RepID=UPI000289CF9D|nr:hypothetical protein [Kurthia senegalensis]